MSEPKNLNTWTVEDLVDGQPREDPDEGDDNGNHGHRQAVQAVKPNDAVRPIRAPLLVDV